MPSTCNTVIDIGVQYNTDFLIETCGKSFHHLFEPVSAYHDDINKNYKYAGINYHLHKIALSNTDGTLFLHNIAGDNSGAVTNSFISDHRDVNTQNIINIEEIECAKLDTLFAQNELIPYEYLVKIDVDGIEEDIIAGGQIIISNASFVIIEAHIQNLASRLAVVERLGFALYDICDHGYYFNQLSQVDLVLINRHILSKNIKFQPWAYSKREIIWKHWQHQLNEESISEIEDPFTDNHDGT